MFRRRPAAAAPCDVLLVCTGNVCRSPMAAAILAAQLPMLTIASAGTAPLLGRPPHEHAQRVLHRHGIPVLDHVGRRLTRDIAASAGLVLTMTREQRGAVVSLGAEAFTVPEISRLLPAGATGSPRELHAIAAASLAAERTDHSDSEEIADPIGQPYEAFEWCFAQLSAELTPLVAALSLVHA